MRIEQLAQAGGFDEMQANYGLFAGNRDRADAHALRIRVNLLRRLLGRRRCLAAWAAACALSGCSTAPPQTPANTTAPAAPAAVSENPVAPPVQGLVAPPLAPVPAPTLDALSFNDAVQQAAEDLLTAAGESRDGKAASPPPRGLVVDPPIDGNSGFRTLSSERMGGMVSSLVTQHYPSLKSVSFSAASLKTKPLLLIGTLTAVNRANNPSARNDLYRVCLALLDPSAAKVVAKGQRYATEATVDAAPAPFDADSPTLIKDAPVAGYIDSCQVSDTGDRIQPAYLEQLSLAATINEAEEAYDGRRYAVAYRLYKEVLHVPNGNQLRVLNGLYLSAWRLGHHAEATEVFGRVVKRGMEQRKLSVKFLFQPNSAELSTSTPFSAQYSVWLHEIAHQASVTGVCLKVVGHTSRSGSPALNEALSQRRAAYIQSRLQHEVPAIARHLSALGVGYSQNLVGTGTDDARDLIDRRVEFVVADCASAS